MYNRESAFGKERGNSKEFENYNQKLSDNYEMPTKLFNVLNNRFKFGADMACDSKNQKIKGSPLFDQGVSGLDVDWGKYEGTKYVFPPFSKPYFKHYLKKAHAEWKKGVESVVVVPIKTLTVNYFEDYRSPIIYILYPRISFIFNGFENSHADSVCLLHYSKEYRQEGFTLPKIEFIDLGKEWPR